MRIVIAPQSLKGSLTATEAAQAIARGVQYVYPAAEITLVPIADGGEGTVQTLVDATGGTLMQREVTGPLGEAVTAFFGLLGDGQTAVIEMAACAGLPLVPPERRNPLITTTYGVGELILAALAQQCTRLLIGIGGSATNDGGAGMAQALGAQLLTVKGKEIAQGGAALSALAHIIPHTLDERLHKCKVEVACDVTNPLCGPIGASAVYGPQKGATAEMVVELDAALARYARIIEQDLHRSVKDIPGAGAAGGLGAGLMAFLDAQLRPGAQIVLETLQFEEHLRSADLVITAEGQIDEQTVYGKSVGAVANLAKRYRIPVLALAGSLDTNYQAVYNLGIDAVIALPSRPLTLKYAMEHADALVSDATERALRLIQVGASLQSRQKHYDIN